MAALTRGTGRALTLVLDRFPVAFAGDTESTKFAVVSATDDTCRVSTLPEESSPDASAAEPVRTFLQCCATPMARSAHSDLISAVAGAGALLCSVDRCEATASSMTAG
jgi:hypothetical protein